MVSNNPSSSGSEHFMIRFGQMRLTIHRGTHEIGGSCVELCSSSGQTRLVVDIGLPLVNSDRSPFEWKDYHKFTIAQLLDENILPKVKGLYEDRKPSVTAVMLSHAHLDHYGLFRFVHPDIPLFMSAGTKSLAGVSNIFLGTDVRLEMVKTFTMWQPFQIGEFTITPYLVDHSAPDAVAFLIEGDGQRIFYTGDFRGHGRKGILLSRIIENPPVDIDYLVMEGSMLGRYEGLYRDEDAVERAIFNHIQNQEGPCYIFSSSQNLDRLVSIYRAAKRSSKTLVIDLYTAFVLDKLSGISQNIPQFSWEGMRVLFSHYHAGKLAAQDNELLYKYRKAKIEFEEIRINPQDKVLLAKDSRYCRIVIDKLQPNPKATAIYSMWHGYLERSDLKQFLESHNITLTEIHTSGHAYVSQLKKLASALKPRFIIPIHTFYPERYTEIFPNVIRLKDGDSMKLTSRVKQEKVRCRALSKPFIDKLNPVEGGVYGPLVELVRKTKDLHLEFRGRLDLNNSETDVPDGEAIGIYYKGNCVLNLQSNGKFKIASAFTEGLKIPSSLRTDDDVRSYLTVLPVIMFKVAARGKTSMEIEYEQMIIRANNFERRINSEYIILYNQYNAGKERWDLLAVKWPRKARRKPTGQLVLIEVKYALNPDIKKGHEQLQQYYEYLEKNMDDLCRELELILRQKLALGLIEKNLAQARQLEKLILERDLNKTEIIFYLVDYNPNSVWKKEMIKEARELPFSGQIRIADGGFAMWEQNSKPLYQI